MNMKLFTKRATLCVIFSMVILLLSLCSISLASGFPEMYNPDGMFEMSTLPDNASLTFYDDLFFHLPAQESPALSTQTSEIPIPEPTTMILFLTAIGVFGYGQHWQKKKKIAIVHHELQQDRITIIGKMTSGVIHDVKNALAGIRTCAEVLEYPDLDPTARQEFFQLIKQEIERVEHMTQELLDYCHGKQCALQLQTYSVQRFIQEFLPLIQYDFTQRNIVIHTDLQYTGLFQIDIEKMKRVFLNIACNARDAMPEGGVFTITTQCVNDRIQITFTDTGCGMSPELQAHFLEPLVTEGKPHGTGLGMAIVKDILEAHQAHIAVKSESGKGTKIDLLFPFHL